MARGISSLLILGLVSIAIPVALLGFSALPGNTTLRELSGFLGLLAAPLFLVGLILLAIAVYRLGRTRKILFGLFGVLILAIGGSIIGGIAFFTAATQWMNSATFSPDGRRIVTASYDGTARVWDAKTGVTLLVLHSDHAVNSAVFSPDGSRIVTTTLNDKTARIWDAHTGATLLVLRGHGSQVYSAVFSPDGSRIVTSGGRDNSARIWDAKSGATLLVLRASTFFSPHDAAFSPDGNRIVTASWDRTARIWDARTGASLLVLHGHTGAVKSAAFSPDGSQIVTASWDRTARVWDARTGATLLVLRKHLLGPFF
jgi:dipeptidyl aminopeptidase/acylaminoacyl peptidase